MSRLHLLVVTAILLPASLPTPCSAQAGRKQDALSEQTRQSLRRFLQTFDEAYWTTRWNEGAGDLRDQLEYLFNAMMQSPEYQLA